MEVKRVLQSSARQRRDMLDIDVGRHVLSGASSAHLSPSPFTYGTTPRTLAFDLRNPSYFNQDLSVRRDFPIARMKLGLGVDVFNLFNTVVFGGIQTNITNANFGRVSSQTN
jgi:hypothetical protein